MTQPRAQMAGHQKSRSVGPALTCELLSGGGSGPSRTFGLQPRRCCWSRSLHYAAAQALHYSISGYRRRGPEKLRAQIDLRVRCPTIIQSSEQIRCVAPGETPGGMVKVMAMERGMHTVRSAGRSTRGRLRPSAVRSRPGALPIVPRYEAHCPCQSSYRRWLRSPPSHRYRLAGS